MAKADMKTCRYKNCSHENKTINIKEEEFIKHNTKYYHKDCYDAMVAESEKQKAVSADLQLIKNLWIENISPTVSYSQLFMVLREYLDRGISSDYLVFAMQYVIEHHLKLNYPFGFRYYVDKAEIKAEYKKKHTPKIRQNAFVVSEPQEDDKPKGFSAPKKPSGFGSILGGK